MLRNWYVFFLSLSILGALGCVFLNYSTDPAGDQLVSIEKRLQSITHDVSSEAHRILRDPAAVSWGLLQNSFFLMDSTEVQAWSNNRYFPDVKNINSTHKFQLSQSNAGDFLINSWQTKDRKTLIAVIPLLRKYPVSNRYLFPEWNESVFDGVHGSIHDSAYSAGSVIRLNGQPIFRFQIENISLARGPGSLTLASISLLSFFTFIYLLFYRLYRTGKFELGFLVLAGAFVLSRSIMVKYDYPTRWVSSFVFDPQYFASSSYNSSIGDLFLNSLGVLVLCGYVFFTFARWRLIKYILGMTGLMRHAMGCFIITLSFFSFLYPFLFVETIFHNSTIFLDITETIQFNWLRSLAWLSVLAGSVSAFFFIHVFIQIAKSLFQNFFHFLVALALAAAFFTTYFLSASRDYLITLPLATLFFLFLYLTNFTSSLRQLKPTTFIYFFIAITALAIQHGLSIKHFVEEKRGESQFKFASGYLIGRDVLGEYLLSESNKRISQDAFIQGRLTNPFLTKSAIRQKIKQVYLNSYFDRYEAKIYLYNAPGEPLDSNTPVPLAVFSEYFQQASNATDYDGIYFVPISDINSNSNKRYLSLIPIYRADQLAGSVLIDLALKRIVPQTVYPELLVDRRFAEFFENKKHSFSFIREGKILSSFGTFNYERDFDFSMLERSDFYKSGVNTKGYFHTGVEEVSGQVAVITSSAYPFFYVLTNFSFFFVLGVFLLVFSMIVYGVISIIRGYKMNYATRIQLYIYLAFSLPLFVATLTTLNRVSKSAGSELNQEFETIARHLGEGILSSVSDYSNDAISKEEFESVLSDRAKITNTDITFYDPSGKYVASSQPLIVESQITSSFMNRQVWEQVVVEGATSMIVDERIGSLLFNNCYVTVKSPDTGTLLGILSVPFFDSVNSLEDTQVNVLSNFLTVFTIIFIIFSVLSFYVVSSLTFPLRFITRILSRTTLSGENKTLEWKSNDEIGIMVSEYNRMVNNLEQSKIELARSQKESAWREIAKQVAHEIKNPLTPMKLTLQQMEYQLKSNKLDDEKARTSINTLLTQVDILNEIASSFSAFARMPAPILVRLDLTSILKKSVNLYSDYEGGGVSFKSSLNSAWVMGDEQLFNRIFSNIILNGLQAGLDKAVMVDVGLIRDDHGYLIQVKDNGKGIEPAMLDKVFSPYFSTKQSGSGLGLAISRQGIEQSGGEIWFDSIPGVGTTFYIRLPAVD